jgi:hypothetical protein
MSDLNEVKKFIENTCGYSDTYTRDLFKVETIKLSSNFFINELTAIGKTNDSLSNKKEKVKNFIAAFLPFLNVSEAASLKSEIQTKAATS